MYGLQVQSCTCTNNIIHFTPSRNEESRQAMSTSIPADAPDSSQTAVREMNTA